MPYVVLKTYKFKTNIDIESIKKSGYIIDQNVPGTERTIHMFGCAYEEESEPRWCLAVCNKSNYFERNWIFNFMSEEELAEAEIDVNAEDFDFDEYDIGRDLAGRDEFAKFPSMFRNLWYIGPHYDQDEAMRDGLEDDMEDPDPDNDEGTSKIAKYETGCHTVAVKKEALEKCLPESFVICSSTTKCLPYEEINRLIEAEAVVNDPEDAVIYGEFYEQLIEQMEEKGKHLKAYDEINYVFYAPGCDPSCLY